MHEDRSDDRSEEAGGEPNRSVGESSKPSDAPPLMNAGATAATPAPPPRSRRLPLSTLLLAANIAVFIVMVVSGVELSGPTSSQLLAWGGNYGPLVAEGQWWRLLSAAFIHIGVIHLGVNMLALQSLSVVERLFGTRGFAFIYLISAIGSSATSLLWRPSNLSAGASGALFGLLGALLAFFLSHRRTVPRAVSRPMIASILFTIGINVVFGLSVRFVDNAAHFGGFVTGFAAGFCLYRELVPAAPGSPAMFVANPSKKPFVRSIALALVVLAAVALISVRVRSNPKVSVGLYLSEASEALEAGDWDAAEAACDRAIEADPDRAEAHLLRAYCRQHRGDLADAKRETNRALELDPDLVQARHLRWQLRRDDVDTSGELHDLDRLVELEPDNPNAYLERAHALYAAGRWKDALRDFQMTAHREHDGEGEAQVYIWLASARLGLRDSATQDLKRYLASFDAGGMSKTWRRIALVLVGESDRSGLETMANGVSGEPDSACRAPFFAASLALLDHADRQELSRQFESCVEQCDPSEPEYWSARAEIDRLAK
jgi:membrane associated rhomboid family serine protease/Tfp pilus assembly protein PilF